MQKKLADPVMDTTTKVQQNVRNLPIASVVLAGFLGAGAIALLASLKIFKRKYT